MEGNKKKSKKGFPVSVLVILTALLFFYFLYINFSKLRYAANFHKSLSRISPAVNLRILKENKTLFRKSFAWNRQEMYITGYFNIADYLDDEPLVFQVNDKAISAFMLFRFRHFSAAVINKYVFVFPDSTYGIKEIAQLEKYIASLFKLLVIKTVEKPTTWAGYKPLRGSTEKTGENETRSSIINETVKIRSVYETSGIKIQNSSGGKLLKNVPVPIPARFKKNRVYECAFEYLTLRGAIPSISMNINLKEREVAYWSYLLYRPSKGRLGRASILFSPDRDINSSNLILRNKSRKGSFDIKKISIYEYAGKFPFPFPLHFSASKIIYDDFYLKMDDEFIYKKYYDTKDLPGK